MSASGYQSALIESLRGASPEEFDNPGLTFFANPKTSPGAVIPRPRARGPQAFNPAVLTMPTITPVLSPPPGDDMAPPPPVREVDSLPVVDDIDVPVPDEVVPDLPDAPAELPPIEDDPIEPLPEDVVLPEVPTVPDALPGDPGLPDLPSPDDRPDGLVPIPDTVVVDVKPPKKDASGWGEGGDGLVRDDSPVVPSLPDPVPSLPEVLPELPELPLADDRPGGLVPIPDTIIVEEKAPKKDASGWGEGGESLVRNDEAIMPSMPDPVPSLPEVLPDLPGGDIPLLPEEVDLPEVMPLPDLPPVLPEPDAPVLPDVPVVPEELPFIEDTIEPLPEEVDIPEVLSPSEPEIGPEEVTAPAPRYTAPSVEVPRVPEPEPVRDPIRVVDPLPEDVILPEVPEVPEVLPVDEVVLPDVPSVPDELPSIDDPIELLPEEVDLPTVDPIPEAPVLSANEAALTDLYQQVFERAPDQSGFEFWLWAMNDLGYTPDMVRDAFLSSPEYQDIVERREAGSGGLLTESGG